MAKRIKLSKSTKKKKTNPAISEGVQAFVARRLVDIIALTFFILGALLLLGMASHNPLDPSLNSSGLDKQAQDITNWAGGFGAWSSDLLMQTIGWGGYLAALAPLFWGVRIFMRQSVRPVTLRIISLIFTCGFSAIAFARLQRGGVFGESLYISLYNMVQNIIPLTPGLWVVLISAGLSLVTFLYACAFGKDGIKVILKAALTIIQTILNLIWSTWQNLNAWIAKYNDESYTPPPIKAFSFAENIKLEMPEIELPSRAPRASEPDFEIKDSPKEDNDEEHVQETRTPPKSHASIPVVQTKKGSSSPKSSGQGRFGLNDGSSEWILPPTAILEEPDPKMMETQLDEAALRRNAELLQNVLADFKVEGDIVSINPGPVVTLYELEPAPGTKSAKVISISDDIARSMSAVSVRCAVVPGRNVIGIELPNQHRQIVYMRELLEAREYEKSGARLPLVLGKDIGGQPIMADLAKMPHLLVAGTTGSGKSVAVNTMILSLLFRLPPEKCRFIMIDPKMLELSVYDGIPHLLTPVVTEPGKAVVSLKWAVNEMEERYRAMSKMGVRNIDGYNQRLREASKNGETIMQKVQTGFDPDTGAAEYEDREMDLTELPYIVIIVDEFADLMLVAGKDVENAIQRLAQMARAAGIHLIMATQRPSVDVITGVIKANFPTRISFQVTSKVDSRTILGEGGAEQLLGMGDMLYMAPGGQIKRVHGPFVSDEDVEKVVDDLKSKGEPAYLSDVTDEEGSFDASEVMSAIFEDRGNSSSDVDELYDQAVAIVAREGKASTSFVQRHLQIGYNRAARIVEEMERQGVISPANSTGKRQVLIGDH